eukprot:comp16825_c0_seq1/m.15252 comp16825_c0_seq1/g.15252  ORF comp16825_c0_seq1/g.15252 comp16825_c0_seq1/m.15252 type:complete len:279 (-) comp16825_c0_seq1:147-983(-)
MAGRLREETLREAACSGDEKTVLELLKAGVDINSQHSINGWTALHWAAHRGHSHLVGVLLSNGADPTKAESKGRTPVELAKDDATKTIFRSFGQEASTPTPQPDSEPTFKPSYMSFPEFPYTKQYPDLPTQTTNLPGSSQKQPTANGTQQPTQPPSQKPPSVENTPQYQNGQAGGVSTRDVKRNAVTAVAAAQIKVPVPAPTQMASSDIPTGLALRGQVLCHIHNLTLDGTLTASESRRLGLLAMRGSEELLVAYSAFGAVDSPAPFVHWARILMDSK